LQWRIIKDLNFRISYAKGFRAPSLKELYLDFQDSNHNLSGNPDLLAETTNSYNSSLTYKYRKDKFLLKVEPSVFYNDGSDVITLIVTDPQTNSAETTNLGGRRTLGANFNIAFVYSGLNLSAGYSLTGESYDYRGTGTWTPEVYYSNYTFNGKYNFRKIGLILLANYKLYGETPSLAPLPDEPGEFYNIYTEPFSDLEVTLSKQFIKNKLNVIIGGKNLLDNYSSRTYGYLDGSEFLSPINYGRTFFIKANYSF
jgi:outer membrane receptor for ferrienterochelin and colicins